MTDWATDTGRFALGDLAVLKGGTIRGAALNWKTHGTLSPAGDNVILYPTSYGATAAELEWLIRPDGVLDPGRWFVVQIDMFGNGVSSSPQDTPDYPLLVTAWDNVHAQRRLLKEVLGIERLRAVYGWSMGAQQAYHWAALFPDAVQAVFINCGSARTAVHNQVFTRAQMAILEAAPEYDGRALFSAQPKPALRAFGRNYAGYAASQDFYRAGLHLSPATPDLETYLKGWETRYDGKHAANLLAQMRCWNAGDISDNPIYNGDLHAALRAIKARVMLIPGETDIYFRVADNEAELPQLRHAELRPIPSIWGHRAGNPMGNAEDTAFLRRCVEDWLA
ncbi:alpha/beta fold hydrolase [Pararoseomonas indoligenes]|uniref:Alpha/beta fold hydrolase n=1 Tax=Roseomonas indoligenes TaxID=2820811 RepID=A0A940N360_9PROT|nr:alpha/beta fold hydrolase [Pararoseomonas indoligenes]MBP0495872.1 alpha/beta fold hydrolase [Pararoseomonas indoligenes]